MVKARNLKISDEEWKEYYRFLIEDYVISRFALLTSSKTGFSYCISQQRASKLFNFHPNVLDIRR